jgi:predicted transcriptional regulator
MKRGLVFLHPNDTVARASDIAKRRAISQFPVARGKRIVGAITIAMLVDQRKTARIGELMKDPFPTLNGNTPLEMAKAVLRQYPAIIVLEKGNVAGIVTVEDVL